MAGKIAKKKVAKFKAQIIKQTLEGNMEAMDQYIPCGCITPHAGRYERFLLFLKNGPHCPMCGQQYTHIVTAQYFP